MKDLMIDLETWGNSKNSVIVQFGGCYFDRHTGEIGETLELNIDAESSLREGFDVWASTIYWWLAQSDDARQAILANPRVEVREAIQVINDFMKPAKQVWSHATFDYVILMGHFERLGIKPKFHYRSARDLRTLVDLADISYGQEEPRVGTHHNALDDCKFQVQYAVKCFNKLRGSM